jgi:hypothetical protein
MMRNQAAVAFVVFSAGFGTGCAIESPYAYRPSVPSVADTQGYVTGVYGVPPERPDGEVRVLSFGIVGLQSAPRTETFPTLHARLLIANNGDATGWTLDTRQVLIDIAGEGTSAALYANSDTGSMPLVTIPRGDRRTVDFYFPVPGRAGAGQRLPAFDLRWQIQTGARLVAERTPFQRSEITTPPPLYTDVRVVAGWGPFWWFHPFYPHAHAFVHRPFVVVPRPPYRAHVVRPGSWRERRDR